MKKIILIAGSIMLAICICISTLLFIKGRSSAEAQLAEEVQNEEAQVVTANQITTDGDLQEKDTVVSDEIEIIDILKDSFKGKLMIIQDPSRVFLGTIPEFGQTAGMTVQDIIHCYNENGDAVIGGVNGGDFVDFSSENSYTGLPVGIVISEGKIVYAENDDYDILYPITGLTTDNRLIIGEYSLNQAVELGIRDAVYCTHETEPFLIKEGEILTGLFSVAAVPGGGKNPRTAIGQRADGAILLLAIDGRQEGSLGADYEELAACMAEYGAVTAAAMHGGTSTQMVYNDELLNNPYSPTGPRKCPTAWLVRE